MIDDGHDTLRHDPEYVSLRDHIERLLHDHASLHIKESAVAQREAALVRTVLEQRMSDHDLRHDEQHRADLRAVDHARESLENRLAKLNELRQEVTADRGEFIKREVFETRLAEAAKERDLLREEVVAIRQDLANAKGRQAAYAAVLAVALVVVPILIRLFTPS